MAAWWVSSAIQAAPYVYGAVTDYSSSSRQSDLDSEYALSNSIAYNQAGEFNAKSIMALGAINSQAEFASMTSENLNVKALSKYNSEKSILLGEYNAQLEEQEALLVLEQANLDLVQLRRAQESQIGQIKTSHGASGAIMNQDTSGAVIADAEEQAELEQFVVQRGADVQFGKLMDSAAQSRWQGYEQANQIILEAALVTSSNITNTAIGASTTQAQAYLDATMTKYNSGIQADQVFQSGMLSSDNNAYSANSSLWSGIFQAGSTIASGYIANKAATTSPDTSLLSNG